MTIPDEIRRHRPKGTEIHAAGGRFYVYKTTSVWDPVKKRPKKKTLGCVGKITTGEGFVPSKAKPAPAGPLTVKEYGCWALFSQLAPGLRQSLRDALGDDLGDRSYALSMIRLMGRPTKSQASRYYRGSWLSEEIAGLALSEKSVTEAMRALGASRDAIMGFMRSQMPRAASTLIFDGTAVLSSSAQTTYARYGRKGKRQINVMYAFDAQEHAPMWYRVLPGNVADMAAFAATLAESGAERCTIVADKGFFSKANVSAMDKAEMTYVLPLRSNTTLVDTSFLDDESTRTFDGCFEYHGRVVWHRTMGVGRQGKRVCVFRDSSKRSQLELDYVRRMEADYGECSRDDLEERRCRFGVSLLYTNTGVDAREVYLTYKARWEIEECFDYLKNGLGLGTVYQRTNEETEAWAFLNHLSLMMFYSLYAALRKADLAASWTPDSVIAMAKNINRGKLGDTWYTTEVSKKDRDVLAALGVTL